MAAGLRRPRGRALERCQARPLGKESHRARSPRSTAHKGGKHARPRPPAPPSPTNQERWLRDLMCQELLATLPALSPPRRRAVDAPLAALMGYAQLQALALGLLLDDLRWVMRSFPRDLAVRASFCYQVLHARRAGARARAWE